MASNTSSHSSTNKAKRTSFGGFPGASPSLIRDRNKAGIRGSTPDSEALASSDDEQDQIHRLYSVASMSGPKPARRSSWLAERQQGSNRKLSLGTLGPFSSVGPVAVSSPTEMLPRIVSTGPSTGPSLGRSHSNGASLPWGSTIWNNDAQKGPPQRLTEVLPSPKSSAPSGSASHHHEAPQQSPSIGRELSSDTAIPFAIPLHPTLKTYRSQSYSVGQLDLETAANPPISGYASNSTHTRPRNGGAYSALHHRPSRPSMLGDLIHDSSLLGQLREVDDDEGSSNGSVSSVSIASRAPFDPPLTIEQLSRENIFLRQTLARRDAEGSSVKPQISGSNVHTRLREMALTDSHFALSDEEDPSMQLPYGNEGLNGRRFSDYSNRTGTNKTIIGIPENRSIESVKKGHWQSSLGFGGVIEPPQSRRHSFADIPTRQDSIASIGEVQNDPPRPTLRQDSPAGYNESLAYPAQNENVNFFSRVESSMRSNTINETLSANNLRQAYVQSPYKRSQDQTNLHAQHRSASQLLYIVTFKCQRADIFYVQKDTGLQVRKGDLVIVEADRGTDLGTVATDSVPWGDAKEIKETFMKDHHRWLMVFSRHTQNGTMAGPNPNGTSQVSKAAAAANGTPGQAVSEVTSGESKPKMIKRLALSHEVQTLREKEGAEAKAKRVCQQKVVEHRLNMEILDAEFQMDWKKLTFFYFADSYINFNTLVTDLFKIYKTRIWMSAINTAAIGSSNGPQHTISGSFGPNSDDFSARHRNHLPIAPMQTIAYEPVWTTGEDHGTVSHFPYPRLYTPSVQGYDIRSYARGIRQDGPNSINVQQAYQAQPQNYGISNLSHTSAADRPDWDQEFQGPSLHRPPAI